MDTETIGRNASRLWQMMNDGTCWSYEKIRNGIKLPDREINAAIGWLAREETIEISRGLRPEDDLYRARSFWDTAEL